jgi:hypothetical protein
MFVSYNGTNRIFLTSNIGVDSLNIFGTFQCWLKLETLFTGFGY